ncbi:hypothetical protein B296_00037265, partial [Ensete ventricosum]
PPPRSHHAPRFPLPLSPELDTTDRLSFEDPGPPEPQSSSSRFGMDELPGILARDFGFRPQGKSAPMAASKAVSAGGVNLDAGMNRSSAASSSLNRPRSGPNPTSAGDPFLGDHGFKTPGSRIPPGHVDLFGGPPSYTNQSSDRRSVEGLSDYKSKSSSSLPVSDKPVYDDDDTFDGVPGLKSTSANYDDIFSSVSSASKHDSTPPYDDLLENLGKPMPGPKNANEERSGEKDHDLSGFDELIPGFGGSSPPKKGYNFGSLFNLFGAMMLFLS